MKTIQIVCVLTFTLTLLIGDSNNASISTSEEKKILRQDRQLYVSDDDVEVLTVQNFKSKVVNSSSAWMVEFYASWCGDCQRFAPSWKAFATDVFAWRDLVRIAVLECSNELNVEICRDYEIVRYPTLRYFHEDYQPSAQNMGVLIHEGEENANSHRHLLIDRIILEKIEGRGVMFPDLLPYNYPDSSRFFDSVPNNTQYVFLVVEPPGSYFGAEVALDIHKTPDIVVKRAFNNNSALVDNLQIDKFPSIVVLDRENKTQIFSEDAGSRNQLKGIIGTFLKGKGIKIIEDIPDKKENNGSDSDSDHHHKARAVLRERIKRMGDVVFQMDLEAALRYSLKQEVSSIKAIKGEQLEALVAYLKVIKKYFPLGHGRVPFLDELTNAISNTSEVEGQKIGEIVKRAEDGSQVFSSPQQFLACEGSSIRYRRYPCSLWKLFHFLTVNSAQYNINNRRANPREVLDAMHGYVKYFFGCQACSEHFQRMALERNLTDVSSLESSILWLWSAHNEVNGRLSGDPTEDPEYPKYQFPTKVLCSLCFNSDDSWNWHEVLRYLKNMYNGFNVRYIGSDTRVLFVGLE